MKRIENNDVFVILTELQSYYWVHLFGMYILYTVHLIYVIIKVT